jgi:hypothetical protein
LSVFIRETEIIDFDHIYTWLLSGWAWIPVRKDDKADGDDWRFFKGGGYGHNRYCTKKKLVG